MIQPIEVSHIQSPIPTQPLYEAGKGSQNKTTKSTLSPPIASPGFVQKYFLLPFAAFYEKILYLLSKVFFCFDFQLEKKEKLKNLHAQQKSLSSLEIQFEKRKGTESFKTWWKQKFIQLPKDVQNLFFAEAILALWIPKDHKLPRRELAISRLDQPQDIRILRRFLVDLEEYSAGEISFDPQKEIPKYFPQVQAEIREEIARL